MFWVFSNNNCRNLNHIVCKYIDCDYDAPMVNADLRYSLYYSQMDFESFELSCCNALT